MSQRGLFSYLNASSASIRQRREAQEKKESFKKDISSGSMASLQTYLGLLRDLIPGGSETDQIWTVGAEH